MSLKVRRIPVRGTVLAAAAAVAAGILLLPEPLPAQAQCGLPGTPPCTPRPRREKTATNTPRPRPTRTPTATPTSTATPTCDVTTGIGCPSPTPSMTPSPTLIPTWTPDVPPQQPPPPPLVDLITTFIGKLAPDPELTAPLPSWMQPPNIELTALEITQAVQCMHNLQCADNSVPLYDGKLTMVRAYVRIKGGPYYSLSNIGGALCYGNTGNAGCQSPLRPLYTIKVFDESNPVDKFRAYLNYTLDFVLPSYMVTGGASKEITVYVNYNFEDEPREGYYKDNYRTLSYQVESSEALDIRFHLVQNQGQMADFGSIWTVYDYIAGSYPTGDLNTAIGFPVLGKDYKWKDPDGGCRKGWSSLITDLYWMDKGVASLPYGLVPAKTVTYAGGCGTVGGSGAAGLDNFAAGRIAAQELGHNLGREHAPGCGAGGPDPNFPGVNGHLDETGLDVLHRTVFTPMWGYDFMGYCGGLGSWTSVYTYQALAGQLPAGAYHAPRVHLAAPLPAGTEVLMASGEVSPTAALLEHGFYRLAAESAMTPTADDGPYAIDLVHANGDVLATRRFRPLVMSNDVPGDHGPFVLVVPWVEGTMTIVFRYQAQEIGRVQASRRSPEVEFTMPVGGIDWTASGDQTVAWSGSDADGDLLQYLLEYSRDGGRTWQTIAPNLADTSFTFDTAYLPGSDHGTLRLVASDGFNTISVDSAPLEVAGKPPVVNISAPSGDDEVFAGAPVVLQGAAIDLEDGFLGDGALSWSSDRDGALGDGRTALLASLTEGPHTLTLTAVDSAGNAASESVQVIVRPRPRPETRAAPPSPLWCLAGAIVAGGLTLAGAFALGRRSGRRG